MDPFARELLDRARDAHEPTPEDRDRVHAKLAARIGVAVVAGGGVAKALGWSWGSILKKTLPFLLLLAAMGGSLLGRSSGASEPPTTVDAVWANPSPPGVSAPSPPVPTTVEPSAPASTDSAAPSAALAPPGPHPRAQPSASTDLEAEMKLISAAQSAIAQRDYATALARLDEHGRAFPTGVLSEERTAARAVALCGAGRPDGRVLGSGFLTRHPSSPLGPRVRSACGIP